MSAPTSPDERLRTEIAALQAERQRLTELLAAAERDRQLFAYELHDGIVQDLTAAAMLLESAGEQAMFASTESRAGHERGLQMLRECIGEARRVVEGILTARAPDERGLVAALEELVARFRTQRGLNCTLIADEATIELPCEVRHALVRIAQEALSNVARHAAGSRAEVRLQWRGDELELCIADNGPGFDPAQVAEGRFGLSGLRARATAIGGKLTIDSGAGQGTRVVVRLPLPLPLPSKS